MPLSLTTDRRVKNVHSLRSDILFAFACLLAVYVCIQAIDVLLLIYVSALFAVVISPAIRFIRRLKIGGWRPGRGLAIGVLLTSMVSAALLFALFALPPMINDSHDLAANWPSRMADVSARLHGIPFLQSLDRGKLEAYAAGVIGGAFGFFRTFAVGVFGVFSCFILTAYFILDGERAFHYGILLFPVEHQERLERTMIRAENRMRHWLIGQAILMSFMALCSGIVFYAIGLKYFYVLAVFAGLVNIVPIVGPITAATVASVVALFDSPTKLLFVLLFFVIYPQMETAFLTPRVMRTTVDLPPLAVIVSLIIGGTLAGIVGALVAVPTAALCAVLIDEYLVNRPERASSAARS
jgi:predicted PurR-regulated permease PerM